MKTIKLLLTLSICLFTTVSAMSATLTENFDSFTSGGYGNYTYNGWSIVDGLSENGSTYKFGASGRSVRLDDDNGAALHSPNKLGGIGTISFQYRNWSSPGINFFIYTSSDSITWTKVDSVMGATNTSYMLFSTTVNDNFGRFIKIVSEGQKMLLLDEVTITDASGSCSGYYIDSIATTICSFDSVEFRGAFYKTAGIYKDTVTSTCDTIFILNLMTRTGTVYDLNDTICSASDSLLFKGSYLKTAGTYYDTIARTGDCDSVVKLNLFVKYCPTPCTELFISEYIEGGSFNKALEFYNPTLSTIDLSTYKVVIFATSTDTISLSGNLNSGDVYVLSHGSASLTGITSNSDQTATLNFNGDDRIELLKGNVVVDRFGDLSTTGNFAKDDTYQRLSSVQNGNLSFDAAEWNILPKDTDGFIGSHTSICICVIDRDTTQDTICSGATFMLGTQMVTMTGTYSDTTQNSSGCDSISTVELFVKPVIRDTTQDTICSGATFMLGTQMVTMTGTYSDTTQNSSGCDSISTVELFVKPVIRDTTQDTICSGATFMLGTQMVTMTGTYSDTTQNSSGCDSISTVELFVKPVIRDTTQDTICSGATFMLGTQMVTMTGTYSDTTQNSSGCDSISTVELFVKPVIRDTTQDTICSGATFMLGTQMVTMTGTYSDTTQNSSGCDSISTVELFVKPVIRDTTQDTICSGATFMLGTQMVTMTGTYSDTTQNSSGCDSISTVELFVKPVIRDTTQDTICSGATFMLGTQMVTMTGTYSDTTQNSSGCDSISTVELFVKPVIRDTTQDTICSGATFMLGTQMVTMTGTYSDTTQNSSGCDSISTVELFVKPVIRDTTQDTICSGATFMLGTQMVTMTGTYSDTTQNSSGCDSISTVELFVKPVIRDTTQDTICSGATFMLGTQMVTMTGTYSDTTQNSSGCDSISTVELFVKPVIRDTTQDTICSGATFMLGTQMVTMTGTYSDTTQNSSGCDSISTVELFVKPVIRDTTQDTICSGATFMLGTQMVTMTGTYSDTTQNSSGCDSISTVELFVKPVIRDTTQDTICSGATFMLGTQMVTMTGTYSDTTQNSSGCDSISTVELFVKPVIRDTLTDTICQGASIVFGTKTLIMTGDYSDTLQNATGCDSITVMQLLVNDYIRTTITDTTCANSPYMLGTIMLTATGIYTDTAQNVAGCDSITTLNLLVKAITRDTVSSTVCNGISVQLGTKFYTTTGIYSDTNTNVAGCDSIRVLDLTVISYPVVVINTTACDQFTTVGGRVVTISGTYIDTLTAITGCDSLVSTTVAVGYTSFSSDIITACGSYISPSGKVWSTSGTRFDTISTKTGCDSIITLTVTIKATSAVTRNISSCFSYTVPETGNTYTTSGTYQDTGVNAFGCGFFITTNLTINLANAGTVSVSGITLTANQTGVTYKWVDCDNGFSFLLGDTGKTFTPIRNGNYAVLVTTPQGCKDTSACTSIISVDLEEYEVTADNISVYPNPATSFVTVDILSQNVNEEVTIRLFDAIGKMVYSKQVNAENNKVVIDIDGLEAGMYSVSVSNEFFNTTKKLTVVK